MKKRDRCPRCGGAGIIWDIIQDPQNLPCRLEGRVCSVCSGTGKNPASPAVSQPSQDPPVAG